MQSTEQRKAFDALPAISGIFERLTTEEFLRSDTFHEIQKKTFQPVAEVHFVLPGLKDPPSLHKPTEDQEKRRLKNTSGSVRNIQGGGSSLNNSLSFIEAGVSPMLRKGGSNVSVLPSSRVSNVSDRGSVYRENRFKRKETVRSLDAPEGTGKKISMLKSIMMLGHLGGKSIGGVVGNSEVAEKTSSSPLQSKPKNTTINMALARGLGASRKGDAEGQSLRMSEKMLVKGTDSQISVSGEGRHEVEEAGKGAGEVEKEEMEEMEEEIDEKEGVSLIDKKKTWVKQQPISTHSSLSPDQPSHQGYARRQFDQPSRQGSLASTEDGLSLDSFRVSDSRRGSQQLSILTEGVADASQAGRDSLARRWTLRDKGFTSLSNASMASSLDNSMKLCSPFSSSQTPTLTPKDVSIDSADTASPLLRGRSVSSTLQTVLLSPNKPIPEERGDDKKGVVPPVRAVLRGQPSGTTWRSQSSVGWSSEDVRGMRPLHQRGGGAPMRMLGGGKKANGRVYELLLECANLRGMSIASDLDTRVVISQAEEYISKKGKWWWRILGETEYSSGTSDPVFEKVILCEYETTPGVKQPVRFDVYGRDNFLKGRQALKEEHIGSFVCDLREIVTSDVALSGRLMSKYGESQDDTSYLQFDVVRLLRDTCTPKELFKVFFKKDLERSRCLDFTDFSYAIQELVHERGIKVSQDGIQLAFSLLSQDESHRIKYEDFIQLVYGQQGQISVLASPVNYHPTLADELGNMFQRYKKDFITEHRAAIGMEKINEFDQEEKAMRALQLGNSKVVEEDVSLRNKTKALSMVASFELREQQHREEAQADVAYRLRWQNSSPDSLRSQMASSLSQADDPVTRKDKHGKREQLTEFISQGAGAFHTKWCKHHKGMGVIINQSAEDQASAFLSLATCNKLNDDAAPCGVRSQDPLPSEGVTYFEIEVTRPESEVALGESLNGPYAIGLCSPSLAHFDIDWLGHDLHLDSVFLLAVIRPIPFQSIWSARCKGGLLHISDTSKGLQVTYTGRQSEEPRAEKRGGNKRRGVAEDDGEPSALAERYDLQSVRADANLPKGTSYFEVTIKSLGKAKGESLGGQCYVGLCGQHMQDVGWERDWTQDLRRCRFAWALNDNYAGQLSTQTFGLDAAMSQREVMKRLREVFDQYDLDKSGSLEWSELHQALKDLGIFSTDDELQEIFVTMDTSGDGSLDFDEFVAMTRSRGATGMLFHGTRQEWTLNSFFGAGDTIGVLVDTSKKTVSFFKNNILLGKAFSNLPDIIYPFVTLAHPGMSATLSMPVGKSMASRSEVVAPGVRRQWVDSSQFGCGDRMGFSVDMTNRSVTLFKNGEVVGKPFDHLPEVVFPVVSLCHTGATAALSFPPRPNPKFIERVVAWLSNSAITNEADVPSAGGVCMISGGVAHGGITLTVPRGDGSRLLRLTAADVETVLDLEVLGWGKGYLVSPVLEVTQLHGPSFDEPAILEMTHCCDRHANLILAYMPLVHGSSAHANRSHQNVWKALKGSTFTATSVSAPSYAGGYFCVLNLDEAARDVVHVEYEFDDARAADSALMYPLVALPGHRVPKFGAMKVGEKLNGRIKVCTRASIDPAFSHCKQSAAITMIRGTKFHAVDTAAVVAGGVAGSSGSSDDKPSSSFRVPKSTQKAQHRRSTSQWLGNPSSCMGMRGQAEEDDEAIVTFSDTSPLVLQHSALRMFCQYPTSRAESVVWGGKPVSLDLALTSEKLTADEVMDGYMWILPENATEAANDVWEHCLIRFVHSTGQIFRTSTSMVVESEPSSDDDDADASDLSPFPEGSRGRQGTSEESTPDLLRRSRASHSPSRRVSPLLLQLSSRGRAASTSSGKIESSHRRASRTPEAASTSRVKSQGRNSRQGSTTGSSHPRQTSTRGSMLYASGAGLMTPTTTMKSGSHSGLDVVLVASMHDVESLTRAIDFSCVVPYQLVLTTRPPSGHVQRHVIATGSKQDRDLWMFRLQCWQGMRGPTMPHRQQASIHLTLRTSSNPHDEDALIHDTELAPFFVCLLDHDIKKLHQAQQPPAAQVGRGGVLSIGPGTLSAPGDAVASSADWRDSSRGTDRLSVDAGLVDADVTGVSTTGVSTTGVSSIDTEANKTSIWEAGGSLALSPMLGTARGSQQSSPVSSPVELDLGGGME